MVSAGTLLAGCAQLRPLQAPPSDEVPAISVLEKRPDRSADLGPIEAISCLNRLWDPRPGWDIALDALKVAAAAKGADALTDIQYSEADVFLCPTALKVSATALKLPPARPGEPLRGRQMPQPPALSADQPPQQT